jgi:RNA polymerase sigma factor (sigma-70 family)
MAEPATPVPSTHPLLADRARLDRIKRNMHLQIQRILHGRRTGDDEVERVLPGGTSVDDVLQDALLALLRTDPRLVRTTWEKLSVRIAQNKAKDALTDSTRGRRARDAEPGSPDDVTVVPLDESDDPADLAHLSDPETAFAVGEQLQILIRLARETLTDRERRIFHTCFFTERSNRDLGKELGITGQAVGQQYRRILTGLYEAARRDPYFVSMLDETQGGKRP